MFTFPRMDENDPMDVTLLTDRSDLERDDEFKVRKYIQRKMKAKFLKKMMKSQEKNFYEN